MARLNEKMSAEAPVPDSPQSSKSTTAFPPLSTQQTAVEKTQGIAEKPSQATLHSPTQPSPHLAKMASTDSAPPRHSNLSTSCLDPFETDVEAVMSHATSRAEGTGQDGADCRMNDSDSRVWPGQKHWKDKAKQARIQRSCTCLSRLSKRNRLVAKIVIGLFFLGIAVSVGVGVSKALGADMSRHNS